MKIGIFVGVLSLFFSFLSFGKQPPPQLQATDFFSSCGTRIKPVLNDLNSLISVDKSNVISGCPASLKLVHNDEEFDLYHLIAKKNLYEGLTGNQQKIARCMYAGGIGDWFTLNTQLLMCKLK